MGLLQTAAAALIGSERRTAVHAQNVSNAQTPGYKRGIAFTEISAFDAQSADPRTSVATDYSQGPIYPTERSLDFAVSGPGWMAVRHGQSYSLVRGGSFTRGADGTIVDGQGGVLQRAGGGDLFLPAAHPEVLADGTVLIDGTPVETIGLFKAPPGALRGQALDLAALGELDAESDRAIKQGALERSNVMLSDELIGLVQVQRLAETGAQLVRAYDQILGQAISTFGKGR